MQMNRNGRKVEKIVSTHLHAFEQSYKQQLVTDTKSRNTSHIICTILTNYSSTPTLKSTIQTP